MELKPYQQQVLADLEEYLRYVRKEQDYDKAFNIFWEDKIGLYDPLNGKGMQPYKNDLPKVPHVCIKVPTAGGKTFIACNAIDVVYRYYRDGMAKAVVWLVPSTTILDQTFQNLLNPAHPYRQRINTHFNNRVEVYRKEDLLQASGFNSKSVSDQLNIFVLSFDSLRSRKKEDRKFFQENGQLISFSSDASDNEHILEGTDETALINVIRKLKPLVIVDEAHGAVSELSVEMLRNLNPSFVLDLTATPRTGSNIISFVDAFALKKENMVKLPVIVYNHNDRNGVIENAINLQRKLETEAKKEEAKGGPYIRPIVLLQAQPKTAEDNATFEKIKQALLDLGLPGEQIKIKTAHINEIKSIDLLSKNCEVRFIITVNALKEGWDCPFAYILASLADKSSAVDVEQILGRILRQPYVKRHEFILLNCSFVLTASSKFMLTLENIVQGLNRAGFSKHDYKVASVVPEEINKDSDIPQQQSFGEILNVNNEVLAEVNSERISLVSPEEPIATGPIQQVEKQAVMASEEMDRVIEKDINNQSDYLSVEIQDKVNTYFMKQAFAEQAKAVQLPQFFIKIPTNPLLFKEESEYTLLSKENLLEKFALSKEDHKINFEADGPEMYKVDLERTKANDYTPTFSQLDLKAKEPLIAYIVAQPKENQVKQLTGRIVKQVGDLRPIADKEIRSYIKRIVEDFSPDQMTDVLYRELTYCDKIKQKIDFLSSLHAEKEFNNKLETDAITVLDSYKLPDSIRPGRMGSSITKSLYEAEGFMNAFEEKVINAVANCSNVVFWHFNPPKRGFCLNGYINHYPDFIVWTKSGKIILIESKGDHLDGENTKAKIRLGKKWASKAGNKYRYFMVFEERQVEGAYKLEDVIEIIKDL
jgi:type III restriction enzyme